MGERVYSCLLSHVEERQFSLHNSVNGAKSWLTLCSESHYRLPAGHSGPETFATGIQFLKGGKKREGHPFHYSLPTPGLLSHGKAMTKSRTNFQHQILPFPFLPAATKTGLKWFPPQVPEHHFHFPSLEHGPGTCKHWQINHPFHISLKNQTLPEFVILSSAFHVYNYY